MEDNPHPRPEESGPKKDQKNDCKHPNIRSVGSVGRMIILYQCPDCDFEYEKDVS